MISPLRRVLRCRSLWVAASGVPDCRQVITTKQVCQHSSIDLVGFHLGLGDGFHLHRNRYSNRGDLQHLLRAASISRGGILLRQPR